MTIVVRSQTTFPGPNVWSPDPIVRLVCQEERPPEPSAAERSAQCDRLGEILNDFADSGPPEALTLLPMPAGQERFALLGAVAINLQRLAGIPVTVASHRMLAERPKHEIVVQDSWASLASSACALAVHLLNLQTLESDTYDILRERFRRFVTQAGSQRPSLTMRSILTAAGGRGLPIEFRGAKRQFIDLGNGKHRRRLNGTITSRTSYLGQAIAQDKASTNAFLRDAGLPAPLGKVARTPEQAITAAQAIGYPVAVKPVDQGSSVGVSLHLHQDHQVAEAFRIAAAATRSGTVLIERFQPGSKYRAVVVGGRLVALTQHIAPHVVGDGRLSIRQLIEQLNADPRRGPGPPFPMRPVTIDDQVTGMLEIVGLTLDAVPAVGQRVQLKPIPRIGDGGMTVNVLDRVHPDNASILIHATAVLGLDIASIDLIARDIAISIWESDGAIIDINISPHFTAELHPVEGAPVDPSPALIEMLFPPGHSGRVPIVAVMGDQAGEVCAYLARRFRTRTEEVGLATGTTLAVGGMELKGVARSGREGIRTILNSPAIEIAVAEVTAESIIDEGLGFDYCDVAVILSCSGLRTPFGQPVESVLTDLLDVSGTLIVIAGEASCAELSTSSSARTMTISPDAEALLIDQILAAVDQQVPWISGMTLRR